jgi:hypothetical protein
MVRDASDSKAKEVSLHPDQLGMAAESAEPDFEKLIEELGK